MRSPRKVACLGLLQPGCVSAPALPAELRPRFSQRCPTWPHLCRGCGASGNRRPGCESGLLHEGAAEQGSTTHGSCGHSPGRPFPDACEPSPSHSPVTSQQTIGNACGTIALLHSIGNNLETLKPGERAECSPGAQPSRSLHTTPLPRPALCTPATARRFRSARQLPGAVLRRDTGPGPSRGRSLPREPAARRAQHRGRAPGAVSAAALALQPSTHSHPCGSRGPRILRRQQLARAAGHASGP
jgi:hypothetical protein